MSLEKLYGILSIWRYCQNHSQELCTLIGISGQFFVCIQYPIIALHCNLCNTVGVSTPETAIVSKEDMENHNREGGMWLVINDKVYDAEPLVTQACR